MLFNSYIYLFVFLPLTVTFFFIISKRSTPIVSALFLIFASIIYYIYWEPSDLVILITSILINFCIGRVLSRYAEIGSMRLRLVILWVGIIINLIALGYYKYADFLIGNINSLFSTNFEFLKLVLPLAISFFTFQQIVYLVESFQGKTSKYNFIDYALVVLFFPHLLAGPIVNYTEIMAQFSSLKNRSLKLGNINKAIFIITIGLFKKVVIADSFSLWVANGFDLSHELNLVEAWSASLSYTLQLYFDFSGYSDIAIGSALLFNIHFPANFNSPYKARNIQDFWRRWHISLSIFLRHHIYIPLGGNRHRLKVYLNLFITFLLGGIWHGAGWNFVVWGSLHGGASVFYRWFKNCNGKVNGYIGWLVTFLFANFAWIFFRAKDWSDSMKVVKGMLGLSGIQLPFFLESYLSFLRPYGVDFGSWVYRVEGHGGMKIIPAILIALGIVFLGKNSQELSNRFKTEFTYLFVTLILFIVAVLHISDKAEFLYFNF